MDSSYRVGGDMDLPSPLSYGYFIEEARRSGLFGAVQMHSISRPNFAQEEIERQIEMVRIHEELIAMEMAQRRLLEEEARIEMEMGRIRCLRRFQMERLLWIGDADGLGIHGGTAMQTFVPFWPEVRNGACIGRGLVQDAAEVVFRERSPSRQHQKKAMAAADQSSLPLSFEKLSTTIKAKPPPAPVSKLSRAKRRKVSFGEPEQPLQKQWGCALCEVLASSEESLKEHIQGKKHRDNEALLSSKKVADKDGNLLSNKDETSPLESSLTSESLKEEEKNKKMTMMKKKMRMKQEITKCSLCNVMCNSSVMMEAHLRGKRHKANSTELKPQCPL